MGWHEETRLDLGEFFKPTHSVDSPSLILLTIPLRLREWKHSIIRSGSAMISGGKLGLFWLERIRGLGFTLPSEAF